MSVLFRSAHRRIHFSSAKTLIGGFRCRNYTHLQKQKPVSTLLLQTREFGSRANPKSPFDANILRILRNEITYQSEYAPPCLPATKFNSFTVQDRPGKVWITLIGKFGDTENIKIEATMFDGAETVPKVGDDSSGEEDIRLHITFLVGISKGDGRDDLEFVCSAWPDSLEVQNVYICKRHSMVAYHPYTGPDFRKLSREIQMEFRKFLAQRGINDELSVFLHHFMMNKDRCELIRWLGTVKSFVER